MVCSACVYAAIRDGGRTAALGETWNSMRATVANSCWFQIQLKVTIYDDMSVQFTHFQWVATAGQKCKWKEVSTAATLSLFLVSVSCLAAVFWTSCRPDRDSWLTPTSRGLVKTWRDKIHLKKTKTGSSLQTARRQGLTGGMWTKYRFNRSVRRKLFHL